MRRMLAISVPLLVFSLLAACLPLINSPSLRPTGAQPSPTDTLTPTTVWFPPTASYTPLPTSTMPVTATLDISPLHGRLIFGDNFSDPTRWETGSFADGIIALANNELVLAVKKERGYLFSLRQETDLDNFYAEITASPSICRDLDEYGILIRVSKSLDFYRFSLTCDGKARVDRYYKGSASSPQPQIMSGAIPPGAPSLSRLAISAVGGEIHFFANNEYLFSINDSTLLIGGIGVFSRASGDDEVTIIFSELSVYEAAP